MKNIWRRPWKSANFSWRQYVTGWAVTFISFVAFFGILSEFLQPGLGLVVFFYGLIMGILPALAAGYPLGLLVAGFLVRFDKKWQHVLGFALGLMILTMLIAQFYEPLWQSPGNIWVQLVVATLVGGAGLLGRLAAWHTSSRPARPAYPLEQPRFPVD